MSLSCFHSIVIFSVFFFTQHVTRVHDVNVGSNDRVLGFMGWILLILDKNHGSLKDALLHTCWIHMVLCFTTLQLYLIQHNLHFGLFWFLYPCLLVLVNDTTAYLFGHWLGQHSLLNLSPKKTLEGYVMAMVCTILFGYWVTLNKTWLYCFIKKKC